MCQVSIVFPHQLFQHNPAISSSRPVYLIEENLFFQQYHYHKQKLVFHRASMKCYEAYLKKQSFAVTYIEAKNPLSDIRELINYLHLQKCSKIHFTDVIDNWLENRIRNCSIKRGIETVIYPSPNFLNTINEVKPFFDKKKNYFQTAFYIDQRKKRKILLDATGEPTGGQWTYDAENRLKYPKNEKPPKLLQLKETEWVQEAKNYIELHFSNNYGKVDLFNYPIDFSGAEAWLDDFLKERFEKFGIYEDAIVTKEHYLHHSVISPLLNIGLLNPEQIISNTLKAWVQYQIPMNSVEGFIRQLVGWREFIRIVYEREGSKQRTKNYWGFTRKIPAVFWTGETGIAPIDNVIIKVLETGYCHHIERLMVLGNFMLLCEFDPDEVYRWFMELFVDAYDWVMVPNIYGMTQFADGGLMTTKPYISGSNYLMKMSDYEKGDWQQVWDGLFWRFMHVHRDFFLTNPRLGMLVKTFDKMPIEKQNAHLTNASKYLENLDKNEINQI